MTGFYMECNIGLKWDNTTINSKVITIIVVIKVITIFYKKYLFKKTI